MIRAVLDTSLLCAWVGYVLSALLMDLLGKHDAGPLNMIWAVCKWPAAVYVVWQLASTMFLDHEVPGTGQIAGAVIDAIIWWSLRDTGDDDEPRRKLRKTADKVKVSAGRLIVAPQTA